MIWMMTGKNQGFPPVEINSMFKCDMTETLGLINSCVIVGYEEVMYLWYVNLSIILLLGVLAFGAIISLFCFRSNHEAANFIGFLRKSNSVFEQIQSQEEKLTADSEDDENVAKSSDGGEQTRTNDISDANVHKTCIQYVRVKQYPLSR